MSLVQRLRIDTAVDHDRVDARYAAFDLTDPGDYADFLTAHARALPAVESALAGDPRLPAMRERASLLAADLAALGRPMPQPLPFVAEGSAERWGALYVIEGSRLGGGLLSRRVPTALPSRYLAATHLPGEWRGLIQAIDAAPIDPDAAIGAAKGVFDLYLRAA